MPELTVYFRSDGTLDVAAAPSEARTTDERGTTILVGFHARGTEAHSDSVEALHEALCTRGIPGVVDDRLTGQFAFLHHDAVDGRLWAVTDRFGTRSLYVRRVADGVRVANHPALLHAADERRTFDEEALPAIASHRRLLGRRTVVQGVERILPGTRLELSPNGEGSEERYWTLGFTPRPSSRSFEEEVDELDRLLRLEMARASTLVGTGPVGVLLSGGVDSSLLAALCRDAFPHVIAYTATIEGFPDPELERARAVARVLGLEHRIVSVTDRDVAAGLRDLVALIGEPPHHQNNFVLAQLLETMGRECPIGVFGWAADTLFGSGQILQVRSYAAKMRALSRVPSALSRALGRALRASGTARLYGLGDALASNERRFLARLGRIYYPAAIDRTLARRLDPVDWMPEGREHWDPGLDLETRSQRLDVYATTGSALLRAERLSHAAGVTPWAPFLTEPIVNYATCLDGSLKVREGLTKPLLRALCDRYLPPEVSGWPKIGFETPWAHWLEGPLAEAAEAARRDAFVAWALGWLGLTIDETRTSSELTWMALCLSICRETLDLDWPGRPRSDGLAS